MSSDGIKSGGTVEELVTLILESGERFDGVPVPDNEVSLKDFLDSSLKALENESRLQLPDVEELIDPRDFSVFDEQRSVQLDLSVSIKEQPYFVCCRNSAAAPCLLLASTIFRNARQLEKENRADAVLHRQNTGDMQSQRPEVPVRVSSLTASVTKSDEVLYMAGRKPYVPVTSTRQNHLTASTSNSSLASDCISEGVGFPGGLTVGDTMDRYLNGSSVSLVPSEDSISIHSSEVISTNTPESIRRGLRPRPGSAPGHSQNSLLPGPAPRPESPNPPAGASLRARHKPLRNTRSTPPPFDDRSGGLDQISEEGGATLSLNRRISQGSQGSFHLILEPPSSPDSRTTAPSPTPSASSNMSTKKRRVAMSRRNRTKSNVDKGESDAAGAGAGGAAEGEEPASSGGPMSIRRNQRTIYAKSRIGSSILSPLRVFGNIKTFTVEFDIPIADLSVQMEIRGDYTVGQIKDNLWLSLKEQGVLEDWWDPENFTFTYDMRREKYELYDEQQIFQMAQVIQLWRAEKVDRGRLVVEEKQGESKEEKTLNMEISAMIGIGLYQLQFANNDELDITRRKMVAVRRSAVTSRNAIDYCMEPDHSYETLPPHIHKYLTGEKFLVRVFYKLSEGTSQMQRSYQTLQVELSCLASELIEMAFPDTDVKKGRYGVPHDFDPNNCVLKVSGQNSYLHGNYELTQFSYIIKCLIKKSEVELTLVKKLDPSMDSPRDIEDWNLIDGATGETGSHSDLSALSKDHTQVFTMSMWDIPRKFRARVVGLDNIRCSDCEVLYVEAGLYHGGESLDEVKFVSEVPNTPYPRWNQWLVFDIPTKCLPKAARLCIQVIGGNRVKSEKKKGTRGKRMSQESRGEGQQDRPLHWINMQILDHRSMLRQGLTRLNMWPVLPEAQKGPISSQTSPMGSTAINPDGNNSAVLYIELDTYAHPVACPTHGWGEDSSIPTDTAAGSFRKELEQIVKGDPLAILTTPQRELLWKLRQYCSTIPEALPKLLRCVRWGNLEQVTEVHRLLKTWRPITLEVALELLDYHFADEKVRALAVRRLEKLSNGEVQSFLLQLVQVLKFEPYHDSALARFLLKRALKSKRLGHYFYWYLRSEMDTSEFNQRFGILLEVYLRGCGEAVFRELQKQHTAVCDMMKVAASIKRHPDKTKADLARESLSKYVFPSSFSPPYDPMVAMGSLDVSKCRIMDSKKTPMWLEFENMDPTATSNKPIIVIAKHGDDLRQDMLTLQMLSLMDKMWIANGLDLHIIPYGCIATGNQMGMIEVVQEAETVAKIQLNNGGSLSVLKDELLHDWLKKNNPSQARFEAAVERFLLSCAGYCVATYILGIGDRHNDNVMVTKSGNLFHIDFGHFLGYKKYFMGMNRERAPFVLTPDFEYVMGKRNSETFKRFEATAVQAYMIIRKNASMIINLFSMMKCTGIPELQSVEDLEYLRGVLVLDKSEAEAADHFRSEIQKCLKLQWSTQLNWFTHNIVHR